MLMFLLVVVSLGFVVLVWVSGCCCRRSILPRRLLPLVEALDIVSVGSVVLAWLLLQLLSILVRRQLLPCLQIRNA